MAIKEIKREWCPSQLAYVKEFLLHSEDELESVPRCSVGSKATVSETDNEYVKTTDGWKLLCDCDEDGGTGGGGSGGVQTVNGIAPDENGNVQIEAGGSAGSGGAFVVNAQFDDYGNVTLDKTYAEVVQALSEGNLVFARSYDIYGRKALATQFQLGEYNEDEGRIYFTRFVPTQNGLYLDYFIMHSEGYVTTYNAIVNWSDANSFPNLG